jgi:hypothetical protein
VSAGVRQAAEAGYGRGQHECAYGCEHSLELESMAGCTYIGESLCHSSARALENLYIVCSASAEETVEERWSRRCDVSVARECSREGIGCGFGHTNGESRYFSSAWALLEKFVCGLRGQQRADFGQGVPW